MSTLPIPSTTSETTGGEQASPRQTGLQPSAAGSEGKRLLPRPSLPVLPADPLLELPLSVRPIVTESQARLISWLRFGEKPIDFILIEPAVLALEKLVIRHDEWRQPITPEELLAILEQMAGVIQTELPNAEGLALYAGVIGKLPREIVKRAVVEVLSKHSYRTMPLPADVLNTVIATDWRDRGATFVLTLQVLIDRLKERKAIAANMQQ
jgi:hypothetical protein